MFFFPPRANMASARCRSMQSRVHEAPINANSVHMQPSSGHQILDALDLLFGSDTGRSTFWIGSGLGAGMEPSSGQWV